MGDAVSEGYELDEEKVEARRAEKRGGRIGGVEGGKNGFEGHGGRGLREADQRLRLVT